MIHKNIGNKVKLMRELGTGYLMVVRKQVNSSIKDGVDQKSVFKTKVPYIVLEKAKPNSYQFKRLHFCEGLGRPGIKVKESASSMEMIPSTMMLHKHIDGVGTRFATMAGPLVKNILLKWLGVIRRGTYQAASEDSRWAYEPLSDLWPDIDPDGDSGADG